MPRNVGGYVGISTEPVESRGILRGIYNPFDYEYFKRLRKIPQIKNSVPTGSLVLYAGTENPDTDRFVIANGANLSRTTYSGLYGVIGTAFGVGDSATTFGLPDLDDHVISHEPTTVGQSDEEGTVPTHDHGSVTQLGNYSSGGQTGDGGTQRNVVNTGNFNNAGGTLKFKDHQLLPLISIQDTFLPVGSILYTFRDTSQSKPVGNCVVCDGSTLSAINFNLLHQLIGGKFGGTPTTFNVPNLCGCHPKCNKSYGGASNVSSDNHPSHFHGPIRGLSNTSNIGISRFTGGNNERSNSSGTTSNNTSVGNGNETRAENFSAHATICTELTELSEGDLLIFLGSSAPEKMRSLSGGTLATSSYPALSSALENNFTNGNNIEILDCRNKYLRATDLGEGRDPDAAARTFGGSANNTGANICGTFQNQSYKSHTHTFQGVSNQTYTKDQGSQSTHYYMNTGNTVDTANAMNITHNSNAITGGASRVDTKRVRTNICMYIGE